MTSPVVTLASPLAYPYGDANYCPTNDWNFLFPHAAAISRRNAQAELGIEQLGPARFGIQANLSVSGFENVPRVSTWFISVLGTF